MTAHSIPSDPAQAALRAQAAASSPLRPALTQSSPPALPPTRGVFACLSNIERDGHWTLPRLFRALSVFGSVKLDLTQAELGAHTDIEIRCFMGNVEIIVPPGVRLECDGDATIGNFEVRRHVPSTTAYEAPSVHIKAAVLLGNIEISVVDPHERSFLQKFRARWKLRDTDPN